MDKQKKVKFIDKIAEAAKDDLILIPRSIRIWIDVLLAIGIFWAMVMYPAYRSLDGGTFGNVDCIYMCVGTFVSCLLLFFAYRAIKEKRGV